MNYELWKLSDSEREEFIAMAEMAMVYRKMVTTDIHKLFDNKVLFLRKYSDFIYRKWIYTPESSIDEVKDLISSCDCIIKPVVGYSGYGIRRMDKCLNTNWEELFSELQDSHSLVEERLRAAKVIEDFHPQSLNSLRVVTMSKGSDIRFIGAILRMGVHGSCIDNTHAGGIFAKINLETGILESDGVDLNGHSYITHPDTDKVIKGTQIPHWDKVIETCKAATQVIPNLFMGGWDICVHEDGRIELIEGNCIPHFDGGMQVPLRQGTRKKVKQCLEELYHMGDMV